MDAPHIGINAVIKAADARFGENRFGEDFSYLHRNYYNGGMDKSKGPKKRKDKLCGCNFQVAANYLSAKKTKLPSP